MTTYSNCTVLDTYPLDQPPTVEELQLIHEYLANEYSGVFNSCSITTFITADSITFFHDPDWAAANHSMYTEPSKYPDETCLWYSVRGKLEPKNLYQSLCECSSNFYLPVVLRRQGEDILDACVMIRCLSPLVVSPSGNCS